MQVQAAGSSSEGGVQAAVGADQAGGSESHEDLGNFNSAAYARAYDSAPHPVQAALPGVALLDLLAPRRGAALVDLQLLPLGASGPAACRTYCTA